MISIEERRKQIRSELVKELLGTPTKKRKNKLHSDIKKQSGKLKFLANPNKHKDPKEKREW